MSKASERLKTVIKDLGGKDFSYLSSYGFEHSDGVIYHIRTAGCHYDFDSKRRPDSINYFTLTNARYRDGYPYFDYRDAILDPQNSPWRKLIDLNKVETIETPRGPYTIFYDINKVDPRALFNISVALRCPGDQPERIRCFNTLKSLGVSNNDSLFLSSFLAYDTANKEFFEVNYFSHYFLAADASLKKFIKGDSALLSSNTKPRTMANSENSRSFNSIGVWGSSGIDSHFCFRDFMRNKNEVKEKEVYFFKTTKYMMAQKSESRRYNIEDVLSVLEIMKEEKNA